MTSRPMHPLICRCCSMPTPQPWVAQCPATTSTGQLSKKFKKASLSGRCAIGTHGGLFALGVGERCELVAFSSDASTGCGTQRLLRPLNGPCILLAAAPTSAPCFCRWQRSPLLQSIPSPALLPFGQQGPTPADGPQRSYQLAVQSALAFPAQKDYNRP